MGFEFLEKTIAMEYNDTSLLFLREKIQEIKVALFKSEINSEICLPNNIVQTISTDDKGNILFFTSCKGAYATQIDQPFYAYLDYHKKGTDIRLRVSGKASIVKEEKGSDGGSANGDFVLVKMKIMQAEYFGQQAPQYSFAQKLRSSFNHFFFPSSEHHFNFG